MKKLIILIIAVFLISPTFAQVNKKAQKNVRKAEKKEQKMREDAEQAALIQTSIHARKFVLEGQFLSNKYGERVVVDPILNFVWIDGEKGAFQLGNDQTIGFNGVGGVTIEGNISAFKVDISKKGVYNIKFRVSSAIGTMFITMDVSPLGNANATISGSTSGKLKYSGKIVPLELSRIFKSSNSF